MRSIPEVQKRIFEEVAAERYRQDVKWGKQNHQPFTWLAILGEEVGEANQAALQAFFDKNPEKFKNYRTELIQVAAVAAAMIECLDTNGTPMVCTPGMEKGEPY